jgi:hypothetical protein
MRAPGSASISPSSGANRDDRESFSIQTDNTRRNRYAERHRALIR